MISKKKKKKESDIKKYKKKSLSTLHKIKEFYENISLDDVINKASTG